MDTSQLEEIIKVAFKDVKLEDGVSLRQAEVMDNYGEGVTLQEFYALPQQEITDNSQEIPDEVIKRYNYLAHMDAKGFRYYIPAFMLTAMRECLLELAYNYCSETFAMTVSSLYPEPDHLSDYNMMHYSFLNSAQRAAIAHFLSWVQITVPGSSEDQIMAERAIRNFWHKYP